MSFLRTSSTRFSAAALAALCLLAPILSYAHMAVVRHATCPEHGELVHLDDEHAPAAAASGTSSSSPAVAVPEPQGASESHEHDHCVGLSARKTSAALGGHGASPTAITSASPLRIDHDLVAIRTIALFRLAPKNSPPA